MKHKVVATLMIAALAYSASGLSQTCPVQQSPIGNGWVIIDYPNDGAQHFFETLDQAQRWVEQVAQPAVTTNWAQNGFYACSWTRVGGTDPSDFAYTTTSHPELETTCYPDGGQQIWDAEPTFLCPTGYSQVFDNGSLPDHCERQSLPIAQCPAEPVPDRNRGCEPGQAMEGNPCNVATGNKYQREIDYSGPDGLKFNRYYNSDITTPSSTLGLQWRGEYDARLEFVSTFVLGTRVHAFRPSGATIWFNYDGGVDATPAYPGVSERLKHIDSQTWELTTPQGDVETYKLMPHAADPSVFGRLDSIRYRHGKKVTLAYSTNERLNSVSDEFGKSLIFGYTSGGKLSTITDPAAKKITYQYNTAGYLSAVLYQDNTASTADNPRKLYFYTDTLNPGALTSIQDENGTTFAQWTYDSARRSTSSQHAGGAEAISLAFGPSGTTVVTDALGDSRTYSFDVYQSIPRVLSRTSGVLSDLATYDTSGFPLSQTDRRGFQTTFVRNSRGLDTSRTEAYGTASARTITTQWDAARSWPTLITESNRSSAMTYDTSGNILTRTVTDLGTSAARTWTRTYNTFGRLLTENGPRTDVADVTTVTYYSCATGGRCGQVQTIKNAANQTTTFNTYNAHGQPLTITDPNGVVTTLVYDPRLRLTSRTVGSQQTSFTYWPTGLLRRVTLPDASYLEYSYDNAHRMTDMVDAAGNHIHYVLDAMGNRTAESSYDPSSSLSSTRTRVYNTLNQLKKEIGADGTPAVTTEFTYDQNGNQTDIDAPLGRSTDQSYDELNRLVSVTDPEAGVTKYGYNAIDQLIAVTDPGAKVTSYTYNALGDLTQLSSPDTGVATSTYDSAGNLASRTDARGKTGTYTYDILNRVTQLSYPDQTITYTYDVGTNGKGRLTSVTDNSGSSSWTYNAQGNVTAHQQIVGGISKSVSYSYSATTGQQQSTTLPSGNVVSYSYLNGRVASLTLNGTTTILSNLLYQPFGPTLGWTWGNSTLAVREYDADGRMTDIDSAGLKTYSYDDASRITAITDAGTPSLSQTYSYDLMDRLSSATGTGLNQSWTYDASGNRLTQGGSSSSAYTISAASNRISSISGALTRSYGYDSAGNTTSDGTATYLYDDSGRMVSATKSSVTATYAINALGQRVKKTVSGASTRFVYDEMGHLIGEYDGSGNLLQETIWLNDIPVATLRPNGAGVSLFYVHTDHLNTPRRISRPSDNVVVWRWDSDPFGTTIANEDPDGDSVIFRYGLRFPGQYGDSETGLNYNYFRDYDPLTGRYIQSDPFGLRGGVNTYAYVKANPTRFVDPFGLQEEVPADTTGAGEKAQRACDAAEEAAEQERLADQARREGDWDRYYRANDRAYDFWRRYHELIGQPIPAEHPPRGPTPPPPKAPDLPVPGIPMPDLPSIPPPSLKD